MELTIIIPVYNVQNYIERAVRSVSEIKQVKYEVICVNDGSTDNSLTVLQSLERKFSFLKVVDQENKGLSGARNTGVQYACGKYIMFLDADDWLMLEKHSLVDILIFINQNNLEVYAYNLEYFNEDNKSQGIRHYHPITYHKIDTGKNFLIEGYQPSSACLFIYEANNIRKQGLKFYPKISQQDVEFTVRLMINSNRVYFSKNILYAYYKHTGTITQPLNIEGKKKYLSDAIQVASLIKKNISLFNLKDKTLKKAIQKNYNSVVWNLFWRFSKNPNEVDEAFKNVCLKELKNQKLYPIEGPLKTKFQNISRYFFNQEKFLKISWRR